MSAQLNPTHLNPTHHLDDGRNGWSGPVHMGTDAEQSMAGPGEVLVWALTGTPIIARANQVTALDQVETFVHGLAEPLADQVTRLTAERDEARRAAAYAVVERDEARRQRDALTDQLDQAYDARDAARAALVTYGRPRTDPDPLADLVPTATPGATR